MANGEDFLEKCRELIKTGEGSISHMYLDTVGKVTVGVGNMLPDADAAVALTFISRTTGQAASADDIRAEFETIQNQKPGLVAQSYRKFTKLDLPESAINTLLDKRIKEFNSGLRVHFNDIDQYPESAQLGLMDMAFNLGVNGLIKKFPSFVRAVNRRDWENCAKECQRRGISNRRNEETQALFIQARRMA